MADFDAADLLAFGDQKEQPGADLNAAWYLRNAKIFAKLTQIAQPGDRASSERGTPSGCATSPSTRPGLVWENQTSARRGLERRLPDGIYVICSGDGEVFPPRGAGRGILTTDGKPGRYCASVPVADGK